MKVEINIVAKTVAALRAIKSTVVHSNFGYYGITGLTIYAEIDYSDYNILSETVSNAANSAGIPNDEYQILTIRTIPSPHELFQNNL